MICVSLYAFGNAIRTGSTTLATFRVGTFVKYVGILGLGPTQLWFGLTYSGRESLLGRRHWALLVAWPIFVLVLVGTAPMHDLLWNVVEFSPGPPIASVDRVDGPVVWLNFVYQYALILATYVLIALVGIRRSGRYRVQVGLMLLGGVIPLAASAILLSRGNPVATLDPTSFAFTITGGVFAVALFRFGFLDLVPIARHTLVEEMSDPIFVVDLGDQVVDVNAAGAELLDGVEQPLGRPADEVAPSDDALESGDESSEADVVVGSEDGPRYFDINRTTLTDRTGSVMGYLLIYRDVTERRIAEERFQRLIERSSDMVVVLDEAGTVTFASESVERVLGCEPTELVGERVVDRVHPDDRSELLADLSEYGTEYGYTDTYVARVDDAAGDWHFIEARATNLLDDPFVEGIVLNARDVTEKRRRKRELERQNERLDQFASVVAHDLRNPLNVAIGRADLLEANVDAEHEESIDNVRRQLDRMEAIITDSLTLARSGETVTETEEVDLETVAREAWGSVDTDGATLEVDTALCPESDRNRLLSAFENLFRNSVEHNDATELTVRVGSLSDRSGFYVEDTGGGIPADDREEVFEQGYTTDRDGTGFGLAIVRDIVQAHGWEISLTEGEEGGARFEIECHETPVEKPIAQV